MRDYAQKDRNGFAPSHVEIAINLMMMALSFIIPLSSCLVLSPDVFVFTLHCEAT